MPTITNKLLTPRQAFAKYGYKQAEDGLWLKDRGDNGFDRSAEQWLELPDGGWLCFGRRLTFSDGTPEGARRGPAGHPIQIVEGDDKSGMMITGVQASGPMYRAAPLSLLNLYQVPAGFAETYEGVSALHPRIHPQAFRWVWTDDEVAFIYQFGEPGWVKEQDPETGAVTMRRSETE